MRRSILVAFTVGVFLAIAPPPGVPQVHANALTGITSISAAGWHTCALTTVGGVKCWGRDVAGEMGDGTLGDPSCACRSIPVDVVGLGSVMSSVSTGGSSSAGSTCGVTDAGGAKCWGWDYNGQLGDGTTGDPSCYCQSAPVDVAGLTSGVSSVSVGSNHACAVTTVGGVKCWGSNWAGQLGTGDTADRSTPAEVVGLQSGVMAVSAGTVHTCALLTSGGVKCWGNDVVGELGDGTVGEFPGCQCRLTPVDVSGLQDGVIALASGHGEDPGDDYTCALMTTTGVKCWGGDGSAQLGFPPCYNCIYGCPAGAFNFSCSETPFDVPTQGGLPLSGVASITAGRLTTCAVMKDGGVKCWGDNSAGQLGIGTNVGPSNCLGAPCSYLPVDADVLIDPVTAIAPGPSSSCVLTTAGGVKCWGYQGYGLLGNGVGTPGAPVVWVPVDVLASAKGAALDLTRSTISVNFPSIPADCHNNLATIRVDLVDTNGNAYTQPTQVTITSSRGSVDTIRTSPTPVSDGTGIFLICSDTKGKAVLSVSAGGQTLSNTASITFTRFRYVALGDSVPYGHGLVNPGTRTQGTEPPNQGPSLDAYPSVVATDLGLYMRVRTTGCTLTLDNLAVSGAPSARANVLGRDNDCPDRCTRIIVICRSTLSHKAVDPEELAAANLALDPPELVTIQVGADDINFPDCIIGEFVQAYTTILRGCVRHRAEGVIEPSQQVQRKLATLKSSLEGIIDYVDTQSPSTEIALLTYYQIAPQRDASVTGGGLVCDLISRFGPPSRGELYEDAVVLQYALNDVIKAVAADHPANVILVDLTHTFDGREMCRPNSLVFSSPNWRVAHPNAEGQKAIAHEVENAVRSAISH